MITELWPVIDFVIVVLKVSPISVHL